jgi:hypothetical protein
MLNDNYWSIPPANAKPIIDALKALGFRVRAAQRLPFH